METTTNLSDIAYCDAFICEKCGIHLEDWSKIIIDEDRQDVFHHEYEFNFCPNCGCKIIKE